MTRQYGKYGGGKGASSPPRPGAGRPRALVGEEWSGPGQERPGPAGATAHLLSGTGHAVGASFAGNLVGKGPGVAGNGGVVGLGGQFEGSGAAQQCGRRRRASL